MVFNIGSTFSAKFSAPLAAKLYVGFEKVKDMQKLSGSSLSQRRVYWFGPDFALKVLFGIGLQPLYRLFRSRWKLARNGTRWVYYRMP